MFDFQLCDYIAMGCAASSVIIFVILLLYNGYDDYKKGRNTSTWRKPS